jgi:hypothetical protein
VGRWSNPTISKEPNLFSNNLKDHTEGKFRMFVSQ